MKMLVQLCVRTACLLITTCNIYSMASTLTCNFEGADICGYTQDSTDDFDWRRYSGPTPTSKTGPENDHTFASSVGHYMYIEAATSRTNDKARLLSPTYQPPSQPQCLEFWYHMHGIYMGTLNVYFKRGENLETPMFNVSGNKGNTWLLAEINIPANIQPFQLVFEGISGRSVTGDIGIDDVNVVRGYCRTSKETNKHALRSSKLVPAHWDLVKYTGLHDASTQSYHLLHISTGNMLRRSKPAQENCCPDDASLTPRLTTYKTQENTSVPLVNCSCGGCEPSCDIIWSLNGAAIGNTSSLQLEPVTRHSAGRYTCACNNPATTSRASIYFDLEVLYGPDVVVLIPNATSYRTGEGSSLSPITCHCGVCHPVCDVKWTFNNKQWNDSLLEMNNITRNDSGTYTCHCKNTESYKEEILMVDVIVEYGPDFALLEPDNTSYVLDEGSSLPAISCDCGYCEPVCAIKWIFKDNKYGNMSSIENSNVSRTDTGNYTCSCSNPSTDEVKTTSLELTVQYGPDFAFLEPDNTSYVLDEGSSLPAISCDCGHCEPVCVIEWIFKDNKYGNMSSIEHSNVSRTDTGNYTCSCSNPSTDEVKTTSLELTVQYGPDFALLEPDNTSYVLDEGSSLPAISCDCGHCEPVCVIKWIFKDNKYGHMSFIENRNVSRTDTGNYTCSCSNPSTNEVKTTSFELTVLYGPDFAFLIPDNTSYVLDEGSSLPAISCDCGHCEPACVIKWIFKDNKYGNMFLIEHSNVSRTDTGNYTCSCSNPSTYEVKTTSLELTVQYGPDFAFLVPDNTSYVLDEGSLLPAISCDCGHCEPVCAIKWIFKDIKYGNMFLIEHSNVSRTDTGNYTCSCSNPSTDEVKTTSFELTVQYGPDFVHLEPDNTSYVLDEGSSLPAISCDCGHCEPVCAIKWTFEDNKYGNMSSIEHSNVSRTDTGNYTCSCSNPATDEVNTKSLELIVQYGPDDVILAPNQTSYSRMVGSSLQSIECICSECEPNCTVEWSKNDKYRINDSMLNFDKLSMSDTGAYMCACTNPETAKRETKVFEMVVNELPGVMPCQEDTDQWGTTWNKTVAGETMVVECMKDGFTGRITRECSKDGEWQLPLYNCIRASIAEVQEKLEELTKNPSSSSVTSVLDELVNITNTDNEKATGLYAGELESMTKALDVVATIADSGPPPTEEQSRSFVNTVSNLLKEENKDSWKSLSESKAESGASKLLQSMDTLSGAMTKGLEDNKTSSVTIIQPNIILEASKVSDDQQEIEFPLPSESSGSKPLTGAKFSLPLGNRTGSVPKTYTVSLYKSLTGVLPDTVASPGKNDSDKMYKLNTPVLSLQVFPHQKKLNKPLEMVFDQQKPDFRDGICSYWNFEATPNRWESDGCRVKRSDRKSIVCECEHLTNFAVLMSPWQESSVDETAIEVISIVGCSISIVCLIATAVLHILLWRNLKNDRAVILINICVALTITYIVFLAGINKTTNKGACTTVAALLHYILLVVFSLMLSEGIEITITVKYVFLTKSRIKWMIPLAWGVPALIVGISLGSTQLEGYGTEHFCWLSVETGVIWAFVGPAMLIIMVNVVFLVILLRTMLHTKAYTQMSEVGRIKSSARCLCVLVPLIGCTWVLGILYVNDRTIWVQYIFSLCNSLQGFFIFLFHACFNKQLRAAIIGRRKKYKDSHSLSKGSHSHSLSKTPSMKHTEVTGVMNPVYSSAVAPESESVTAKPFEDDMRKMDEKKILSSVETEVPQSESVAPKPVEDDDEGNKDEKKIFSSAETLDKKNSTNAKSWISENDILAV